MIKTALLYDPYFDTQGGGERYLIYVAKVLSEAGYKITLAWNDPNTLRLISSRFGVDPKFIQLSEEAFGLFQKSGNLEKKRKFSKKFDISFWISDGSIPFLFSKKNLIHYQVPFTAQLESNPIIKLLKLHQINYIVYNSQFTKNVLEHQLPKNKGVVIFPPIDTEQFSSLNVKKTKTILSVARFDSPSHPKRQDVLIEAFRDLYEQFPEYKLVLAGGLRGGSQPIDYLKTLAKDLPVEFVPNPNIQDLTKLYSKAEFFWHAAGYDIDEIKHPESVEHFGMTTVEAMAAGCIPLVINKGGQKEIVTPESGVLWNSLTELTQETIDLINNHDKLVRTSKSAYVRSNQFNLDRFKSELLSLVI